eukprot:GHRR01035451.1.p1 GENE.GHRR01035451.1~~GHRR01035451.1.p1  ORF type:complete len:265 (+),score=100.20 GHRR01035451.1:228-1022(+)
MRIVGLCCTPTNGQCHCRGVFTDEYKRTIGVDFLEKQLYVPSIGQDVHLYVWDTAGQEEFDSITKTYYRGAGAAALVFSTTDRASFDALPSWKVRVQEQCSDIAMVLVQNKVGLLDKAVVSSGEAEAMARRLALKFYRTCVKEDMNINEVFTYLIELHERKASGGQHHQEEPVRPLSAAASDAAPSNAGAGSNGSNSTGKVAGVSATAVTSGSTDGKLDSGHVKLVQIAGALPANVELHPISKRGKKKLGSRLRAAKLTQCSIQ